MLSPTEGNINSINNYITKWPSGELDLFRKKASFDWKQMKMILEGDDVIKFKHKIWSTLSKDPLFHQKPWDELNRDEERKITMKRLKKLSIYNFVTLDQLIASPHILVGYIQAIGQYSSSLLVKRTLSAEYFILSLTSDKSTLDANALLLINDILTANLFGCISITEMSHGSDAKKLQTTAVYDANTKQFILNTPTKEATKVWSGVLGQTATNAIVFAQLITPDNHSQGIHAFMVPIRDPSTFEPYKGLCIGDMGPKIGLNGVDNGFLSFNNYAIPKSSLITHRFNLSDDGIYISKNHDSQRYSSAMGLLSVGRIFIILMSLTNMQTALVIAIRYSAIRTQFGPENGNNINNNNSYSIGENNEYPLINYQTQQWRLIPFIAISYVVQRFFGSLFEDFIDFYVASSSNESSSAYFSFSADPNEMAAEIHALSSCAKAMVSWYARDAIQECRECCGGHGYLKASRLGDLRNDHDANNTYEGDNTILLQQTANHLIKLYRIKKDKNENIKSPFGSMNFINSFKTISNRKTVKNLDSLEDICSSLEYLLLYILVKSNDEIDLQMKTYNNIFDAKNASQVYYLRTLSMVFFEFTCVKRYSQFIKNNNILSSPIKLCLEKLGKLYGLTVIEKYLIYFYETEYFTVKSDMASNIRSSILRLCNNLKDDCVSLVECYAPPDLVLNSSLGCSNGSIYENIFEALKQSKGAFNKPEWLNEFINDNYQSLNTNLNSLKSKL